MFNLEMCFSFLDISITVNIGSLNLCLEFILSQDSQVEFIF